MTEQYFKKLCWFIPLIISLLVIGCTTQSAITERGAIDNIPGATDRSSDATGETSGTTDEIPSTTEEIPDTPLASGYSNAALSGTFSEGDKVEYLGVKGAIVMGQIENGKVTSEPLQINNDNIPASDPKAPLLVYTSFEQPAYGTMAMVHYAQRGEGEYDLYDGEELVATMKFVQGYSRNAYVTAACEPDSQPEFAEQMKAIVIKKVKECS
ncbi:MAG: hypothetical protein KJ955_06445 [Nanoarchaeota archaeon]|nr:hypothetical protein [Nanoarchaeota archaeon]